MNQCTKIWKGNTDGRVHVCLLGEGHRGQCVCGSCETEREPGDLDMGHLKIEVVEVTGTQLIEALFSEILN